MKITKWIDYSQEVEIEIGAEDISVIFSDDPDIKEWLYQINSIASFLTGTPTNVLEQLTPKQAQIIGQYFKDQGERIEQYLK